MRETPMVEVRCRPNQWGNNTMHSLAQKAFQDYPEAELVLVWEHAGWFLVFRRDGKVINSANDCAVYPREIEEYRRNIRPKVIARVSYF